MSGILEGKTIVVSGGTKGLGCSIVKESAKEGANIAIGGRDEKTAEELISQIKSDYGRDGIFVKTDLSNDIDYHCKQLIDTTIDRFGKIDGFVNYAGILPAASLVETREEMFDDVFAINMKAAYFCAKYALSDMMKGGGGSLVFIGSAHAYGGEEDRAAYACSKGALLTLTKHIAKNYAKYHIRANWVTMGWVATPGELDLRNKQGRDKNWLEKEAAEIIPMGRLLTAQDHVPGIIYLLSDMSSMVTGTELHITGGFIP